MYSRTIIALLFTVLFSIIISNVNAYRLTDEDTQMNYLNQYNGLIDPYIIQQLLAIAEAGYDGSSNKDSSSQDHIINTRFAINRRPGLIRLRKSD